MYVDYQRIRELKKNGRPTFERRTSVVATADVCQFDDLSRSFSCSLDVEVKYTSLLGLDEESP